ncbi:MAG: 4-diphosphocytidyl-2C-methyl-D-erythritol kinase [Acidobacteriota bacterium]|nr:4-diphosphocytidyl-2C-methyl-D-erythritol kinase [Acidobacteriota bacterium]
MSGPEDGRTEQSPTAESRSCPPPRPLRALAPAKVNLGLFIGPTGPSGRHELVSVMQSISLADVVTLEPAEPGEGADAVLCPGVPGEPSQNIAALALGAFRSLTGWGAPPLRVTVEKRVPVAAGLGGGSGDAAAVLRLAARAAGVRVDSREVMELAARLGSDVPAQVHPGRWLALGSGERLRALAEPTPPLGIAVLPVPVALTAAAVYAEADRMGVCRTPGELDRLRGAIEAAHSAQGHAATPPAELLHNDLEAPARSLCPAIGEALARMRATGAAHVLVSGSGPTVGGLFGGPEGVRLAREAAEGLRAEGDGGGAADVLGAPSAAVAVDASFGDPRELEPSETSGDPVGMPGCHNGASSP